jgi:hypothetical protein
MRTVQPGKLNEGKHGPSLHDISTFTDIGLRRARGEHAIVVMMASNNVLPSASEKTKTTLTAGESK